MAVDAAFSIGFSVRFDPEKGPSRDQFLVGLVRRVRDLLVHDDEWKENLDYWDPFPTDTPETSSDLEGAVRDLLRVVVERPADEHAGDYWQPISEVS